MQIKNQAREANRQFIERESHYLWGRRYLLTVVQQDAKPRVAVSPQTHHSDRSSRK